jgi:hypothetical protein
MVKESVSLDLLNEGFFGAGAPVFQADYFTYPIQKLCYYKNFLQTNIRKIYRDVCNSYVIGMIDLTVKGAN